MVWAHAMRFGGSADAADVELEELERRLHGMAVTATSLQGARFVHDGDLVREDADATMCRSQRRW